VGRAATPGTAYLVRDTFPLVEGFEMTHFNKPQPKSECPAATGRNAEESTNISILPAAQGIGNPDKHFATLRAQFALQGHRLERAFHGDSKEPTYYAERWGMVRYLPTLHDAAMFLAQIRGRP